MANLKKIKLGKKGERKARWYLRFRGWRILERNFKNPFGEVDIIARKGDTVAFIEVKTRTGTQFGMPSEAVNEARKERYRKAAKYYFANREIDCTLRFDVIEILNGKINRIENAFQ